MIPLHLAVVSAFFASLVFNDKFAQKLRNACAILFPVMLVVAAIKAPDIKQYEPWMLFAYGAVLATMGITYYVVFRNYYLLGMVLAIVFIMIAVILHAVYLNYLADCGYGIKVTLWGGLFFILALAISLFKGGVIQKSWKRVSYMLVQDERI
ncbi:MAG: hypothetical protein GY718_12260 [Lentisphaerae bacterium]|nr:hypothetical protein [Lentisphaerota bacterium]